jgi:hypothetical protein
VKGCDAGGVSRKASKYRVDVQCKGIVLKDNAVVHYLEAGQGPALALIHGFGGFSAVWSDDIAILAKT